MPAVVTTAFTGSITFGTSTFTGIMYRSIATNGMHARGDIETSYMGLADGAKTYIPSDLQEPGTISVDLIFDPTKLPPAGNVVETITVNWKTGLEFRSPGICRSLSRQRHGTIS